MKYKAGVKAGKLANGLELGKGKVVHVLDGQYSLCGQTAARAWAERELADVTCAKCIKKLRKELTVSTLLNGVDEMTYSDELYIESKGEK